MAPFIIPTFFLTVFSFFNLFGVERQLVAFQLIYFAIGIVAFLIIKNIGLASLRQNAKLLYYIFIGLLVLTFVIGLEVKGSRRWIDLGFFNFQASELFKVFFILFLADFFVRNKDAVDQKRIFITSLFYFAIPFFIIFKQPDLGNAMTYAFIYFILLIFSSVPKRYLVTLGAIVVLITPIGWFTLKDYQKQRLTTFVNPKVDVQGSSYNRIQSIITVGSGKFLGRGLGSGPQTKLSFLPENHTDFAFASLVEQFGFIGGLSVIGFFGILAYSLVKRALKFFGARDDHGKFSFMVILGLIAYLSFQVLVNIGMNLGILPIVGVALPIISYGGSAFATFLIGLALIP